MSRAPPSGNQTAPAHTSRYTAKLRRQRLSHISLANILAGHTCSPIGLADFEAYLAFTEHSLENLHFAVWYQSYRKRYFALVPTHTTHPQHHCRSDSFRYPLPTPARTTQRLSECKRPSGTPVSSSSSPTDSAFSTDFASPSRHGSLAPPLAQTSPAPSHLPMFPPPSSDFSYDNSAPHKTSSQRSLRIECARAMATFLTPSAPEELMLDAEVRDAVLRELTWSIHPDAFLSVYESVVEALETFSLPRFLEYASANINSPKQIFWYSVGIADMLLAITLAILLIALLPNGMGEASRRAWRLTTVPLFSLGSMQAYSAWRGFCSEVWGRGNTQLRVWELDGTDRESMASSPWSSLSSRSGPPSPARENVIVLPSVYEDQREGCSSYHNSPPTSAPTSPKCQPFPPDACDEATAVPDLDTDSIWHGMSEHKARGFGQDIVSHVLPGDAHAVMLDMTPSQSGSGEYDAQPAGSCDLWGWEASFRDGTAGVQKGSARDAKPSRDASRVSARAEYRRAPVFGPERPVLDPHIRAVHRAVMRDMLVAGFVCTVVFTVVVLAVPSVQSS